MSCSPSAGIGAQERALRQLNILYEVVNTCDCDPNAVLSYVAMRWDLEKEMETFEFPSQDKMIEELQAKNLGYDFQKGKHGITKRTPLTKLKQYYIADKLSSNLGDISKVDKLPYADIITYSFCCQDLSVAGKGEGMKLNCDECDHSWLVDFEHPENNGVCPNCGNTNIASTRSGLLGQVQRLLGVAKENNTLPKYLLLENVKNLIGKKFKPQFDAWVKWLDSIGYNTYYQVLNAKNYGIPQNRERVFAISIRKDVDTNGFTFPEPIPLTTRLKDILEHNVDEKYYLPDDRIEKILNSSFMQEKKRIQTTDVCDTLLARDWKDPKCVPVEEEPQVKQIGNVCPTKTRSNPNQGRVYDKDGIAPALTTMDGGNREPMVVDEIRVVGNYMPSNHDASRVVDVDGIAPTVKENHGTVTAIAEPFIVASRGRNPENPSDRTTGSPTEQRLEPNFSGTTNCLTSVAKDNYVAEPTVEKVAIVEDQFPGSRDARIYKEYSPTLRQNCNGLKVANGEEETEINPKLVGGIGEKNFGKQYRQGNRVYDSDEIAMALNAQPVGNAGGYSYLYAVEEEHPKIRWRIRKLTPKECIRLMNFTDRDYESMAKYVSNSAIYKAAGNSIVVACLIAIFSSLFLEDGYKSDIWTKYSLNYCD